jgi:hypothetical protein
MPLLWLLLQARHGRLISKAQEREGFRFSKPAQLAMGQKPHLMKVRFWRTRTLLDAVGMSQTC